METKKLEILVTEDNVKHLTDARSVSGQYVDINFTFASTLQEAESLIEEKGYDAVVTDVFFPIQEGGEPTSDAGLNLAKKVDAKNIPFVYNTSGNHHGEAYSKFLEESRKIWDNDGFGTGKMIEAYPEECEAEKDTKQWNAAIDYAILLARAKGLEEKVRDKIGSFLKFASYGDYGKLTSKIQRALDKSLSLEELGRIGDDVDRTYWSGDALEKGKEEGKEIIEEKRKVTWGGFSGAYEIIKKILDKDWSRETETKFKQDYAKALEFIRTTLTEYRK